MNWGWIILWMVAVMLGAYEILALGTSEKIMPSISRWIWTLQKAHPVARSWVLLITIIVFGGIAAWLAIHFYLGECSFKTC
jgi:hypothetical protein